MPTPGLSNARGSTTFGASSIQQRCSHVIPFGMRRSHLRKEALHLGGQVGMTLRCQQVMSGTPAAFDRFAGLEELSFPELDAEIAAA